MIRIAENRLIIEIQCKDESPLSLLANIKEGLLNMIEVADLERSHHAHDTLDFGMVQIARLIKHMSISADQLEVINNLLTAKTEAEFNSKN